ncbi:ferredoxin [Lapillicoccus sp.]|uniref:ferredoxin n=1 Tax=Lapillicoccus sp. TaxID=1909287 RepID=UPI0025F10A4D|nr:ferredoxin [Lapillicoccus sp.]
MSADRSPAGSRVGRGVPTTTTRPIVVDRVACTGRGICASILTEQVSLDEWGYPVVRTPQVDPELGEIAVRLCPARALSLGVPS